MLKDDNHSRRNLVVLSLAIIAVLVGGGSVKGNELTLPLVSISFSNPGNLATLAWIALAWYVYRYYIIHRGVFKKEFTASLFNYNEDSRVKAYINNDINIDSAHTSKGNWEFTIQNLRFKNWRLVGTLQRIDRDKNSTDYGREECITEGDDTQVIGPFMSARILTDCFISTPAASSYLMPHLLWLIAVFLGLINLL